MNNEFTDLKPKLDVFIKNNEEFMAAFDVRIASN